MAFDLAHGSPLRYVWLAVFDRGAQSDRWNSAGIATMPISLSGVDIVWDVGQDAAPKLVAVRQDQVVVLRLEVVHSIPA